MKVFFYFIIGWLVPGLGHVAQKRYARGIIFFVCISAMTAMGIIMGGKVYPWQTENPLTVLAFFADIGNSLFYIISRIFSIGTGTLERITFEFGTTYIAGAGLLNYLIALDASDIASGKKK